MFDEPNQYGVLDLRNVAHIGIFSPLSKQNRWIISEKDHHFRRRIALEGGNQGQF